MITKEELLQRQSISIDEAAEVLGICRTSAYAAAKRGEIPAVRIGARLRVSTARLLSLLDGPAEGVDR